MTTEWIMLPRRVGLVAMLVGLMLGGCSHAPRIVEPVVDTSPYQRAGRDVLWAVAPLRNESGTSQADPLAISDDVVAAVEQVRGISAVPLNRVIAAMRALGLAELSTPTDARRLGEALDVDGLIVGSITAYDPYDPPTLGLALALYLPGRPDGEALGDGLGPRELEWQPASLQTGAAQARVGPVALASELLDAKSNDVLLAVQRYARGRVEQVSASAWHRYTRSMVLYRQFAAHEVVGRLIRQEWIRLARAQGGPDTTPR